MSAGLQTIAWKSSRICILWVDDWWDWELAGVANFDGRRIYFKCIDENEDGNRKFALYDVPEDVWRQIDEQHNDFQLYVGTHCDLEQSENGRFKSENVRPQSEHHKFYDKWKDSKIEMNAKWQIAIADSAMES